MQDKMPILPVIADLHIHSRYSRATSSKLNPASLERWARIKGLGLLGTGDCTHPQWLSELRENLDDAEPGLFMLREDMRTAFDEGPALAEELPRPFANSADAQSPRFVLTGEISTIYKRGEKTRKIHHLVILPDFKSAAAFQIKLERAGNIRSDGRPILGLDSRDLLSMLLDVDERAMLIPAHIWTPWFSALGARSGFDSIEECYGDLVSFIPAIETGLSSDPPMNWVLSSLDRFSIVSNSDAHSPDKLGREATIFDMELSYNALRNAMHNGVIATIEFFPEEGKYHYDGHRKCNYCSGPEEETQYYLREGVLFDSVAERPGSAGEKICPVCGKPLTRGVMGRVMELADRPLGGEDSFVTNENANEKNKRPFYSFIPLGEILGELLGTGAASKKVRAAYSSLIEKTGSELSILMDMKIGEIEKIKAQGLSGELLATAIDRMRRREVSISPGYDGEYGVIRVFPPGKSIPAFGAGALFAEPPLAASKQAISKPETGKPRQKKLPEKNVPEGKLRKAPNTELPPNSAGPGQGVGFSFDSAQQEIINYEGNRTIVIAGPGTGKTAILAAKIAKIINNGAAPDSILALSFSVKAAAELQERISGLIKDRKKDGNRRPMIAATFHSFCCSFLRENAAKAGISENFGILDEAQQGELLQELCKNAKVKAGAKKLAGYIEERKRFLLLPGELRPKTASAIIDFLKDILPVPQPDSEMEKLYSRYRDRLREMGLLDYEDLISGTVRLLGLEQSVLGEYQRHFRHIFVDEYQDINLSQYALLRLLSGADTESPSLWAIGDPNQAIYGFRGSDKRFIDRFIIDYPDARCFELTRSFRCADPIISAAGQLTGSGLRGIEKPVGLFRFEYPTAAAEAEGVSRVISRLIGGASFFARDSGDSDQRLSAYADSAAPGDCAVLLRAAPLAAPVAKALTNHGIPFKLSGQQCWWDEEPFKSFLARLRESASPEKEFQKEKGNPGLKQLFDLASLLGNMRSLLDALAYSGPGSLSETGPEFGNEGVTIMSIHASKGLEFDHVFVIGLEDGILPFTLYEDKTDIDEERRLLYVAMTRARVGLYLSWAHSRVFRGRKLKGYPSPFLSELEQIIPLAQSEKILRRDGQLGLFND